MVIAIFAAAPRFTEIVANLLGEATLFAQTLPLDSDAWINHARKTLAELGRHNRAADAVLLETNQVTPQVQRLAQNLAVDWPVLVVNAVDKETISTTNPRYIRKGDWRDLQWILVEHISLHSEAKTPNPRTASALSNTL